MFTRAQTHRLGPNFPQIPKCCEPTCPKFNFHLKPLYANLQYMDNEDLFFRKTSFPLVCVSYTLLKYGK